MSTPQMSLKKEAAKYLSLADLFPKGKPDLRRNLNKYQEKKIKKAVAEIKKLGGEYHGDMVPVGRGRKKFLTERGLPKYARGVFLPGGTKKNKQVKYVDGELRYTRGNSERSLTEINTLDGEAGVIKSVAEIWKKRAGRSVTATAGGRAISSIAGIKNKQLFTREILYTFNKYENAFLAQQIGVDENTENVPHGLIVIDGVVYRDRKGKHGLTPVARPSDWGMGVLFEGKAKK